MRWTRLREQVPAPVWWIAVFIAKVAGILLMISGILQLFGKPGGLDYMAHQVTSVPIPDVGTMLNIAMIIAGFGVLIGRETIFRLASYARRDVASPYAPSWISSVLNGDRDNLGACFHIYGDPQVGHVSFDLENKREPSIWFTFWMVNASIFEVHLEGGMVKGQVQADHELIAGHVKVKAQSAGHNGMLKLQVQHVISTDASVNAMKDLLAQRRLIVFDLGSVALEVIAEHDPQIRGALRIPQQNYRPAGEAISQLAPSTSSSQPTEAP